MRQSFTISIHQNQGKHPPFSYQVTPNKLEKIIALLKPEITKTKKKMTCTSVKLDGFFNSSL